MTYRFTYFLLLALLAMGLIGCSNPVSSTSGTTNAGNPTIGYTISYDGNTSVYGKVPKDGNTYQATDVGTVADNTAGLGKPFYRFTGWNTKADGSGTNYAVGNSFIIGNGNVTLYAVWIPSNTLSIIGTTVMAGSTPPTGALIIPPGVTTIDSLAFSNCDGLTSVTIPNSVTSIGSEAFADCLNLTSVNIPGSVTSIGDYAFVGTGLTSVTIPEGITTINIGTFLMCENLTSVKIPDSVISIRDAAFLGSGLTGVTIPKGVTSIGDSSFANCMALTSVTIPSSVSSIGMNAFLDCTLLGSVTVERSAVKEGSIARLKGNAFDLCSPTLSIKVPYDSLSLYQAATNWDSYSAIITGY